MPDPEELDEVALEEAAAAHHDTWCADEECAARDDDQGYLDTDLTQARATITAYLGSTGQAQEVERLRGASRKLVVAVRMHTEMCRKLGITEGHGPGRWPEEVALSDLLALTPSVEGGERG